MVPFLLFFVGLAPGISYGFVNDTYYTDRHRRCEDEVVSRGLWSTIENAADNFQGVANSGGPLYNAAEAGKEKAKQELKNLGKYAKKRIVTKVLKVDKQKALKTAKELGKKAEELSNRLDILDKAGFLGDLAGSWSKGDTIGGGQAALNTLTAGWFAKGGAEIGAIFTANPVGAAIGGLIGALAGSIFHDSYVKPAIDENARKLADKVSTWEENAEKVRRRKRVDLFKKIKAEREEEARLDRQNREEKKIRSEIEKKLEKAGVSSEEERRKQSETMWKWLQEQKKRQEEELKEKAEKEKREAEEAERKKTAAEKAKKEAEEAARKKAAAEKAKKDAEKAEMERAAAEKAKKEAELEAKKKAIEEAEKRRVHEENLRKLGNAVESGMIEAIKSQLRSAIDSADTQDARDQLKRIVKNIQEALRQEARNNNSAMQSAIDRGQADQRRKREQWGVVSQTIVDVLKQYGGTTSGRAGGGTTGSTIGGSGTIHPGGNNGGSPSDNSGVCQQLQRQLEKNGNDTVRVSQEYGNSGKASLANEIERLRTEQQRLIRRMKEADCPGLSSLPF